MNLTPSEILRISEKLKDFENFVTSEWRSGRMSLDELMYHRRELRAKARELVSNPKEEEENTSA